MVIKKAKLVIINTHPIFYHINFYKKLSEESIDNKVFYLWDGFKKKKKNNIKQSFVENNYLPFDFRQNLLKNYKYEFIENKKINQKFGFFDLLSTKIFKRIIEEKPNILMCYGYNNFVFFLILLLCKIFNIKFLLKGEVIKHKENLISKIYKFIFFFLSDFIAYSCKKNKEYFESYKIDPKKLFFFPCAVDNKIIQSFFMRKSKKENYFYAGKIIERKNLIFLIDGFIDFNKKNKSNLFIIGNGYIKKKLIEKYKNYKFIKFLEHMNYTKLFKYINEKMKYLIISSNYDPSPKIINECLNLKIPIICSDNIGTAGDLVRNNFNGLIYKSGDKEHFSRQLKKIKDDYKKYYINCHSSLKRWDDKVSVKNMLKILKNL